MCPGLTEVVVFGGMEILSRTGISKTSVLQFGELLLLYTHVVNRATIFWTMCPQHGRIPRRNYDYNHDSIRMIHMSWNLAFRL